MAEREKWLLPESAPAELLRTAPWPSPTGPAAGRSGVAEAGRLPPAPAIPGYEIIRELNHGGQGVVYQAVQQATKQPVAVKVLLEGPYAGPAARRRFEREIELVAQLKHAHIVSVFHAGQTPDGRQLYVMEYVQGIPLTAYAREQKLGLDGTLRLFAKVCEAVQFAHQRDIIHRDLKPSNVLVSAPGARRGAFVLAARGGRNGRGGLPSAHRVADANRPCHGWRSLLGVKRIAGHCVAADRLCSGYADDHQHGLHARERIPLRDRLEATARSSRARHSNAIQPGRYADRDRCR